LRVPVKSKSAGSGRTVPHGQIAAIRSLPTRHLAVWEAMSQSVIRACGVEAARDSTRPADRVAQFRTEVDRRCYFVSP